MRVGRVLASGTVVGTTLGGVGAGAWGQLSASEITAQMAGLMERMTEGGFGLEPSTIIIPQSVAAVLADLPEDVIASLPQTQVDEPLPEIAP